MWWGGVGGGLRGSPASLSAEGEREEDRRVDMLLGESTMVGLLVAE